VLLVFQTVPDMSLPNSDAIACYKCSSVGVTLATCPVCNDCRYCRTTGDHARAACPLAPPCEICGITEHDTKHCKKQILYVKPPVLAQRQSQAKQGFLAPSLTNARHEAPMLLNIQVPSSSHDEERWFAILQEIRDVWKSTFSG
jgi:hypothetical protein